MRMVIFFFFSSEFFLKSVIIRAGALTDQSSTHFLISHQFSRGLELESWQCSCIIFFLHCIKKFLYDLPWHDPQKNKSSERIWLFFHEALSFKWQLPCIFSFFHIFMWIFKKKKKTKHIKCCSYLTVLLWVLTTVSPVSFILISSAKPFLLWT